MRAEDGRSVESVDVSPFINDLPHRASTAAFCSADASGSTSQAANIVEALEAGLPRLSLPFVLVLALALALTLTLALTLRLKP